MRRGYSLVEVLITVALVAFLAMMAIHNIRRARLDSNEANARMTVTRIASMCESYAFANNGTYPLSLDDLVNRSLINDEDFSLNRVGYNYSYVFNQGSLNYNISAVPAICNITGKKIFTVLSDASRSAVLIVSNCSVEGAGDGGGGKGGPGPGMED